MLAYNILAGSTDVSVVLRIVDSTNGTPETGVVYNTSGIDLEYRRELAASTDITEVTLAALTTAHADGGFLAIGNGYYRLDLPDAAVAAGVSGVLIHGTVTGMVVIGCYINLTPVPVDVRQLLGTAWLTPGTAGTPDVNTKLVGGTAQTGRDIGTSVLLSSGTGTGQLKLASGYVAMTWADIAAPTTTVNFTGTTIKTATDVETDTAVIGALGAGLTGIPWNAAWDAEVQSEVDDALVVQRLDELLAADSDIDGAAPPTVGSVFHELLTKTAGSFTYDQTTDSLEAVRDRGDAAWITATGFATPTNITAATGIVLAGVTHTGAVIPTVTTLTGHTPQTGDSFARIGAAGASLTAVPWNASWDAEVQSEATDALNAYDPPTNTEFEARTIAAATYATATNITAGTITTVTNLTNAPTTGDLTATMKTSVTTAATASTPALSAAGVDAILDDAVDGSVTLRQLLRGFASALLGKASGLGTTTAVFRDLADTKPRITATVDADGNRSAVTTDLT